jgi:hypothetical protein
MTLNEIIVLCKIDVFPEYEVNLTWELNAVNDLRGKGLITPNPIMNRYDITQKGQVLVDFLRNIPLPVPTWHMPKIK